MVTHGSIFSGIGGFDLAAQWAGFENVYNCEIDAFARSVLAYRFPQSIQFTDVTKMENPPKVDILSGGFPCQDISHANTTLQSGIDGTRSGLFFHLARIIDQTRPAFVVMENVAALAKNGLDKVLQTIANIGYDAEWAVITAERYGAPHNRARLWIVAYPNSYGRDGSQVVFGRLFTEKVPKTQGWEFSRTICHTNGKKALPPSFGVYDGVPVGVDFHKRIAALGNAIVPQIAHHIFTIIKDRLNGVWE